MKDIPDGGTIAVANDPTNEARALFLLQAAGLIKIKEGVTSPTVRDIVSSSKFAREGIGSGSNVG